MVHGRPEGIEKTPDEALARSTPDHSQVSGEKATELTELPVDAYPDGGSRAWLVVLGAWLAMIPSMGLLNSLSVFQAWLSEHQLADLPPSTTGWIFSGYAFFLFFSGAQVGPIFDKYEMRWLIAIGTTGNVLALIFVSLSSTFYQFFLSFSVLGGISGSLLYTPALSVLGHWFLKKRGTAIGLACTSGGFGGIWMPFVILYLAPQIGFGWSIRVIALICLLHGAGACILLKKRLPPKASARSTVDFKAFRDLDFTAVALGLIFIEFAIFAPITYICSYAIHAGFNYQDAYMLNAILNIGAVPGRFLPNYTADRFGVINTMFTICVCSMVSIFALWWTAGGNRALTTAFTVVFGFWSGATVALAPVAIGLVCDTEDLGKRNGTAYTVSSFGTLIGIPLAGAILQASGGDYQNLILFSGLSYVLAIAAYLWARFRLAGWKLWVAI